MTDAIDSTGAPLEPDAQDMTSDESWQQPTIRKKQRMNGQKTCRVCGDRALAHNFDVVSCESCKAFFRRNALKTKIKPCAFNGDCEITSSTRRFCAHCRLKKCLLRGMKANMIWDADEKKARQGKLTENRRKREKSQVQQQQPQQPQTQHLEPSSPPSSSQRKQQMTTSYFEESKRLSTHALWSTSPELPEANSRCTPSTTSTIEDWVIPPPCTSVQINRSLRGSSARHELIERARQQATLLDFTVLMPHHTNVLRDPQQEQAIDTTFKHISNDQLPSDPYKYWRLKEEERALLTDLTVAYQDTVLKLPEFVDNGHQPVNVQSILSRCQRFARDIINFVKRVPDFRALTIKDQIAVLKGASWRTFLVKSSANFVVERNAWIKDQGYLSVEEFTEASPEHKDRILLLARYSAALKHIIRSDATTFAVLQLLVLFNPQDPNLIDRQLVSELADKYALLLKHLLQSHWSYDFAGHYLSAVRNKLQEMVWVADNIQVMFMDWLHLLEPLMREVLNLS